MSVNRKRIRALNRRLEILLEEAPEVESGSVDLIDVDDEEFLARLPGGSLPDEDWVPDPKNPIFGSGRREATDEEIDEFLRWFNGLETRRSGNGSVDTQTEGTR